MKQKRKIRRRNQININYIIYGAAIMLLLLLIVFLSRGCGVSVKSPEKVVKSLVNNSIYGNERKVKMCYGVKKAIPEILQKEIDSTIKYYEAHRSEKAEILECDILYEEENRSYVYIIYNLILEDEQEYPCIGTYMVKKEKNKYYIMSSEEITDDMRNSAADAYAKFMTTDMYKTYTKNYEAFSKRNPGYEDRIAERLN